ncbi:multidrug transporter [Candidatus Bathyarchaeota archaeon]|nr:MAG: multidrug transporter [Candidatus Bathyarchaeota archaeon]
MDWFVWTLISLVFYSLMPPLVKEAMKTIPSWVAVTVTNAILCTSAFIVAKAQGYRFSEYLGFNRSSLLLYGAGIVLAVAIISYYKALELGSVSRVVPIYGMYVALSSLIGIVALGERLTPLKGLGLLFATLSILLLSR